MRGENRGEKTVVKRGRKTEKFPLRMPPGDLKTVNYP